jgi:multiple sugar transport system substrate-binding protein
MDNPGKVNFKQIFRMFIAVLVLAMAFLAGCQGLSYLDAAIAETEALAEATPTLTEDEQKETPTPQATATAAPLNYRLTVWVSPQFNPNDQTPAAQLLAAQFKSFTVQYPEVSLDIRVKAASGAGSILDTLDYASQVAAEAEPDLVLLSRADMEIAAQKGLLQPIEELSSSIDESDWYDFARSMSIFQGTVYGLPLAADSLGLVYRNAFFSNPQPDWQIVKAQIDELIFPAGDPNAQTSLAIYLSAGGTLQNAQGQAFVNEEILTQMLQIYQNGLKSGLISTKLLDLQSDDQAWDAFLNSDAEGIITWVSRQLQDTTGLKLAQLPSLGESSFTLAKAWVWCVVSKDQNEKEYASLLVEHLVDPEFLADWAPISGYLPVRPSSLAAWGNPALQDTLGKILDSSQVRPNPNQITPLSSSIKTAVQEVLSGQSEPADSAKKAADSLEVVE